MNAAAFYFNQCNPQIEDADKVDLRKHLRLSSQNSNAEFLTVQRTQLMQVKGATDVAVTAQ